MSIFNKENNQKLSKESLSYFRKNNTEFFNTKKWIKVLTIGVLIAITLGTVHGFLYNSGETHSIWIFAILGFFLSNVMKKITGTVNFHLVIATLSCYTVLVIVSISSRLILFLNTLESNILISDGIKKFITINFLTPDSAMEIFSYFLGGLTAYYIARK